MKIGEEATMTIGQFKSLLENEGGVFEIECPTGWEKINVFYDRGERDSVEFSTDEKSIICSEDHKFFGDTNWKKAIDFNIGDSVRTKNGIKQIKSIKKIGKVHVYDLWIDSDEHAYYSNDFISHNCGKTTTARILAMGLNCEKGDTVNPCCECPSCKAALAGEAMHITEYNMSSLSKKEDADDIVNSMYNSSFTGRNNVTIMDECLHYSSNIDCWIDGCVKKISIGNIVHNKMNVNVLSLNYKTGLIEIKPVVNWFKNPKKTVYEWVFERLSTSNSKSTKKVLTCTDNHTVFLRDTKEEVQIGTLKKGDIICGNLIVNENCGFIECGYKFIEKRYNPKKNLRGHVYDIEVADNHNYFASGINVHNCQGMSTGSQNLMLKMLENPPSNTYIILATTDPQKILKTVKTRCEQYEFKNPCNDDIKNLLASVVKQEMPEMNLEQRKQILEASRGLGFREILMKLEKFIKGGGTGNIEEMFQADYFELAKQIIKGNYQEVLNQIEKSGDSFEVEAARRLIRTFLCNQIEYSMKNNNPNTINVLKAFRVFDKGFYTDPNPIPSFKADLFEACMIILGKLK